LYTLYIVQATAVYHSIFSVLNWCTILKSGSSLQCITVLSPSEYCRPLSNTVIEITLFVVLVLHQPQVSSCMETTTSDIDISAETPGCHTPSVVIVLKKPNMSRYISHSVCIVNSFLVSL